MKGLRGTIIAAAIAVAALVPTGVRAERLNDRAALAGLHVAKGIFLVNVRKPIAVAHLIRVIGLTARELRAQKVAPRLIVVFIGPDVAFLTRNRRGIPYTEERTVATIQKEIAGLARQGIRFQACGVALHGMDVRPSALIAPVTPVENGFISVIGYQEKGYALIPVG
ncbi:hypothetical protein [Acidiferrobacter sp.]|uniref:DsrE family protein n=1 Tax=Acidiferrobacter sp. TaxID=1872107 RepID=UPI00261B44C5|nr:hypothetical protein [Acidiferrobacter sp.]